MIKIVKMGVLLPLFFIIFNCSSAKADQLAWLTKDEITKAMDFIKSNDIKEVILYCACCNNNVKAKVTVSKIYYRQVKESKEYYEVVIKGTLSDGTTIKQAVDLAYVHIKKDDKAVCLGLEAGFQCDPCTKPFDWD
jgi:hypothetical protein